jgi:esterase/lipase
MNYLSFRELNDGDETYYAAVWMHHDEASDEVTEGTTATWDRDRDTLYERLQADYPKVYVTFA